MAAKGNEQRTADALEKGINTLTFNPSLFAHFITSNHIKVQSAVYDILIACIAVWANRYDHDVCDSAEGINLYAKAKRISEHLQGYK